MASEALDNCKPAGWLDEVRDRVVQWIDSWIRPTTLVPVPVRVRRR